MSNMDILDPRRRSRPAQAYEKKRQSSHSPEPERPSKQQKQGPSSATASPTDPHDSRRSSMSTAGNRSGAPGGSTRTSSTQPKGTRGAEGSLISPASPQDSGSGHSTPGPGPENAAIIPILAALQSFSTQAATQATLQIARRQADESYKCADAEYKRLKPGFKNFPALEEKKNQARIRARQTLHKAEEDLKRHMTANNQNLVVLASLIGSAGTSRAELEPMNKKQEDIIGQYNSLSTSVNALQGRLAKNEDGVAEAKRVAKGTADDAAKGVQGLNEARAVAQEAKDGVSKVETSTKGTELLEGKILTVIDQVKISANEALQMSKDTKLDAKAAFQKASDAMQAANAAKGDAGQIPGLQAKVSRVMIEFKRLSQQQSSPFSQQQPEQQDQNKEIVAKVEAVEKEFAIFKTQAAQYALKGEVGDLESKLDTLSQDVAGLRKAQKEIKSTPQATNGAHHMPNGLDASYKYRVDQLWQDSPKLAETVADLETTMARIQSLTIGKKEKISDTMVDEHGSLLKWITHLDQGLRQLQNDHTELSDGVNEPGKGTANQRFKHIDRAVNNLSTRIGGDVQTTVPQQLKELEKKLENFQHDLESRNPTYVAPSQNSLEEGEIRSQQAEFSKNGQQGNLVARVPELEKRFNTLRKELDGVMGSLQCSVHGYPTTDHATVTSSRLDEIERQLQSLPEHEDEKDKLVAEMIWDAQKASKEETDRLSTHLEQAKDRLDQVDASVKKCITKEAFSQSAVDLIHPMRSDVQQLQKQVKDLEAQKPAQRSTPTPQPSAQLGFVPSSPMPNGVPSPHLNGPNPPQRVPTPHGQCATQQDVSRLQGQIDANIMATQHLKQRYDNLTTDELVKAMSMQMSGMFPEARNFEAAHKALSKRMKGLETEVEGLKKSNSGADPVEMHLLRAKLEQVEKAMAEADELLARKIEQEVADVKKTAEKAVAMATTPPPANNSITRAEFDQVRKDINDVHTTANVANQTSEGHGSRFKDFETAQKKRFEEVEEATKKQGERITGVEGDYKGLKKDFDDIGLEIAGVRADLRLMKEE